MITSLFGAGLIFTAVQPLTQSGYKNGYKQVHTIAKAFVVTIVFIFLFIKKKQTKQVDKVALKSAGDNPKGQAEI